MYPLLLCPNLRYAIWGGEKLSRICENISGEPVGRMLLLHLNEDYSSVIKNGDLKGHMLYEVLKKTGTDFLGKSYDSADKFPLQISAIDAFDRLPLTVCDSDKILYIESAQKGAQMVYGFNEEMDRGEVARRITTANLSLAVNYIDLKEKDLIFVPRGLIHAVGKGVFAYEITEGECNDYPVSDYGRTDRDGKSMVLKPAEALSIISTEKHPTSKAGDSETYIYPFGTVSELKSNRLSASVIHLDGNVGVYEADRFCSVVLAKGEAVLSYPSGTIKLKTGDSLLIPADMRVKFTGFADIIVSKIKA